MSHVLTLSQLIERSVSETKKVLKTYILGSLIFLSIIIVARAIGTGFAAVGNLPEVHENFFLVIPLGLMAIFFILVSVFFQVLFNMFSLIFAVDRKSSIRSGITLSFRYFWRLLFGNIWLILRSYIWIGVFSIPFFIVGTNNQDAVMTLIGVLIALTAVVCGIYFFPRLAFTNIIQLKEKAGVCDSASRSMKYTQGYWGKIIGNNFLLMTGAFLVACAFVLVAALILFALAMITETFGDLALLIIGLPVGLVAVATAWVFSFACTIFLWIYMVEMYETLKKHPRVTAS